MQFDLFKECYVCRNVQRENARFEREKNENEQNENEQSENTYTPLKPSPECRWCFGSGIILTSFGYEISEIVRHVLAQQEYDKRHDVLDLDKATK